MKVTIVGAFVGISGGILATVCGFTFPEWRAIAIIALPVIVFNLGRFFK